MNASSIRKASTVIIVSKTKIDQFKQNYKIFMLKRSSESKFMPNAYVFPGGVEEQVDNSKDWTNIFQKNSKNLVPNTSKITGIREVFEESGILLFTKSKIGIENVKQWRDDIHKNSQKLIEFCEKYECIPDIESLISYSNWLTPKQEKRRYDTDFYITRIDEINSEMIHDGKETTDSQWISPKEALESFEKGNIYLAPPTWYTIREMNQFNDIDELIKFCKTKEVTKWEPTIKSSDNNIIIALPGDPFHETINSGIYHRIILESKTKYKFMKSKL